MLILPQKPSKMMPPLVSGGVFGWGGPLQPLDEAPRIVPPGLRSYLRRGLALCYHLLFAAA